MPVALKDRIRVKATGEVTTIAALAASGRVKFTKCDKFRGSARGPNRVAYFAELSGGGCWEINKTAYESRMGIPVSIRDPASLA